MVPDIVAEDREGRPVAVVEVKALKLDDGLAGRILDGLKEARPSAPFRILVDLDKIRIATDESEEVDVMETGPILKHYEPEYGSKRIFPFYLEILVGAWLRDVARRWKHLEPPGLGELTRLGIAGLLDGGGTRSEAELDADALR